MKLSAESRVRSGGLRLHFVWVGKTRNIQIGRLTDGYLERIKKFSPVAVSIVRDAGKAVGDKGRAMEREAAEIEERTGGDSAVVLLDPAGRQMSSPEFASYLNGRMAGGTKSVAFVLGGPGGVSDTARRRADLVLSLGAMTLTHEMARLVLVEQVYRAFTIINNFPYRR